MLSVTPYNLDLTASDRANYVESKSHTMIRSANGTQLLLVDCGCVYERGLILVDAATNDSAQSVPIRWVHEGCLRYLG
jgi:hypothetical protein